MNEVDEEQDPTTGQEGETLQIGTESINIGNLSALKNNITPIVRILNENPRLQIPVYDPDDQQWYSLSLNRQNRLVVIMSPPNGPRVEKLLDIRSTRLLFNKEPLKPYEEKADEARRTARTFSTQYWGVIGHENKKSAPDRNKIEEAASKLAGMLSEKERELKISIQGNAISLTFLPNNNLELDQLQTIVMNATGEKMTQHDTKTGSLAGVGIKQHAKKLMIAMLNALINNTAINIDIQTFKVAVSQIPEAEMRVEIRYKRKVKGKSYVSEIEFRAIQLR